MLNFSNIFTDCYESSDKVTVFLTQMHSRGSLPNADRRTPNAERQAPIAERRIQSAECRTPNAECRKPNAEDRTQNAEGRISISSISFETCAFGFGRSAVNMAAREVIYIPDKEVLYYSFVPLCRLLPCNRNGKNRRKETFVKQRKERGRVLRFHQTL